MCLVNFYIINYMEIMNVNIFYFIFFKFYLIIIKFFVNMLFRFS